MKKTLFSDKFSKQLRVAFPAAKSALQYEPTKIHLGYEYIFLENIFSPLFEIDPRNGQITKGIAKDYHWDGDNLVLQIRNDIKTVSGWPISSEDVVFSLKRLLVLSGNTHGNFKDLVCPNENINTVDDSCEGIKKVGDKVILKVGAGKAFVVPMLAAIDFAIIPKHSVNPKTLSIINFKETSGPYYVSKDSENGHITLETNPNHYKYSPNIPQVVHLIPENTSNKSSSLEMFKANQVDLLTTINKSEATDVLSFAKENKNILNIHLTHRIQNLALVFTDKGQTKYSRPQRHKIGQLINKALQEALKKDITYQKTDEFFAPLAEGALSPHQKSIIISSQNQSDPVFEPNKTKCKIGILRKPAKHPIWSIEIKKLLPVADVFNEDNSPEFKKYSNEEEKPDAVIFNTDTGFSEDIGLISYHLSAGSFGLEKISRQLWLSQYMQIENKEKRIEKLKELHFSALNDAILVPIAAAPYIAIIRKPWKFELSEMQANNQLWLIKK